MLLDSCTKSKWACLNKRVDVVAPICTKNCCSELLAKRSMNSFQDCVHSWIFYRRRFRFDAVAVEQFLEFVSHEFVAIVVNHLSRLGVPAEQFLLNLLLVVSDDAILIRQNLLHAVHASTIESRCISNECIRPDLSSCHLIFQGPQQST